MYGKSDGSVSRDSCDHSKTIDNHEDGEEVCILCGLVLDRIYEMQFAEPCAEMYSYSDTYEWIENICKNNNIPEVLIDYSFDCFKKFQVLARKFKDSHVAAYAVYESLKRFNIPRAPEEIEQMTGIAKSDLWKIERELFYCSTFAHPKQFVSRYCSYMYIPFYHVRVIEDIVSFMVGFTNVKPCVLIATCIFLYSNEMNMKLSLKRICEVCNVSSSNVMKVVKRMHPTFVQNISLWRPK